MTESTLPVPVVCVLCVVCCVLCGVAMKEASFFAVAILSVAVSVSVVVVMATTDSGTTPCDDRNGCDVRVCWCCDAVRSGYVRVLMSKCVVTGSELCLPSTDDTR